MSIIAYNQDNLLSCLLESHIIETATLKLKLSSPRCIDLGGWGFLQSLPNTSTEKGKQPTYVHPLSKQYSSYYGSKLSEASLKLCTENLGSETGTDIADTAIFSSDFLPESSSALPRQVAAPRNRKKVKGKPKNLPPPLTTLIAPNSLQVRSRREGGRLIIVAIEGPPKHAFFKAERSHGRLRLSFLDASFLCSDSAITNVEDEGEEERDMDGNILEAEVEMGMEKYQRLRRCMESGHSNKALCDLKPLCVATS
nr:protein FANTASTIC FOUR 3-like [Ipomoea trifida]